MKDIKLRYSISGILIASIAGVWLGYVITSKANFPDYILLPVTLLLFGAALFFIPFKSRLLRMVLLLVAVLFFIPLISASIGVTFNNTTGNKLNIICTDINSRQIRRATLVPKESLRLTLCRGDSPNQFKDKVFSVLVTDAKGKIYYQGLIKIAELEKYKNILINSPLDTTLNEPNNGQTKVKTGS